MPLEIHSVGQTDGQGRFAGVHGSARDISERERLEAELRASEERYRSVIQSSPDLIWATNKAGRYEFVSDRVRDLLGWEPERGAGPPVPRVHRRAVGGDRPTTTGRASPSNRASPRPIGSTSATRTGRCGRSRCRPSRSSGTARSRTSTASRATWPSASASSASCARARSATGSSSRTRPTSSTPRTRTGVITYFSESVERVLGWVPQEVVGRHFRDIVRTSDGMPGRTPVRRARRWFGADSRPGWSCRTRTAASASSRSRRPPCASTACSRASTGPLATSASASASSAELRESEERYRYLVQSSPGPRVDDRRGRRVHVRVRPGPADPGLGAGGAARPLVRRPHARTRAGAGRSPGSGGSSGVPPRPIARGSTSGPATGASWRWRSRASGWSRDGRFLGAHGAARDVSERERLERGLRRQAAELASSEERSHLARELHDSVTQALFSMTLLSRSIELLLDKDPSKVPEKLVSLRELQRDALAEMRALIFELRPGQRRGVRPDPGAADALGVAVRADRAAGRRRGGAGGAAADRGRGDALPDRAGGAPQRRQARRRARGAARGRARRRTASASRSPTTAAASTRPRCPTATSGWPACARAPSGSAAS